ncbi:fructose-1-phosphate/6-phosphogluconate phosphatase [Zophobihabitans entericus]|uniref:Fructose-1-phosphate/6-phosphogluconate phosphatase n=1 Tax=Zophobihabitans entericus TaxID=1635327 RepID=A0A6G9IAA7_9GAMM|nr:fructose-1-phosphate/6-phosphogluconate phosphatase [Zophobihabitans entericus]QIQ20767.1 fructose-1-phosphate/6-phosphogluconate phosphatase [Zophobihabitans entericus]
MSYDNYQALIFDMDGTVFDTEPAHVVAWNKALANHGVNFEDYLFEALNGAPTGVIAKALIDHFDMSVDPQQLAKEKTAIVDGFLLSHTTMLPIVDVIRQYHNKKPMALGTGSNRYLTMKLLAHFDLLDCFSAVVTADDVVNHKPAPDTFLKCAELLQVEPTKCVVFEDSDFGMTSAKAAGMAIVDVRPLYKKA